jgi:hypothetical protein
MAEKISKMEAVRRAMAELGTDATPTPLQAHVKDKYGLDMTKEHVSVYKRDILRKLGVKPKKRVAKKAAPQKPAARKAGPKKAAVPKPQVQPAAASRSPAKSSGKAGGIALEDILAVKGLVGRLGARPLHTLIDAFAK